MTKRDLPWSSYKLPSGCMVFLTSRPDIYVESGALSGTFNEIFGNETFFKPTIRLSFTDDFIKGSFGERHVWIPWFVANEELRSSEPTMSSIATAITLMRTYESLKSCLWLHCDSSSMRSPTYFGLYLRCFYPNEITEIMASTKTNMPDNYHWSSPAEYAQIAIDRNPKIMVLLQQIREKMLMEVT